MDALGPEEEATNADHSGALRVQPDRTAQAGSTGHPQPNGIAARIEGLRRHGLVLVLVAVGGLVGGVAAFTSAVDTVADGVLDAWHVAFPLPTPTPKPPNELEGRIAEVRLGASSVPLADVYRDRPNLDPERDGVTDQELAQLGQLVSYKVEFQGLLGRRCWVKWSLYDAVTGERVVDLSERWETRHARGWPDVGWEVQAPGRDVAEGEVWVPHVARGRFVVEIELYDDQDQAARLDSERPKDAEGRDQVFVVT